MGMRTKALYRSSSLWNSWKCLNFLFTCHVNSPWVSSMVYTLGLGTCVGKQHNEVLLQLPA